VDVFPELFARVQAWYDAFTARDADTLLAEMAPDVSWANGWEGGTVEGRAAVREYWTRQWTQIHVEVRPEHLQVLADGLVVVEVLQVVRDTTGAERARERVQHRYRLTADGLIASMRIGPASPRSGPA
jgi:uncharacterized protein (TIGR02246 family)